jgi:diguanylate cyclase (GGDEF)-like protein/PAS domain S-box-containing protein
MHSKNPKNQHPSRAAYLEKVNRGIIQALQLVLEMGRQGTSLNRIDNPHIILQEVQDKIGRLIPWEAAAFYLPGDEVDEQSADLSMALCTPAEAVLRMNALFERMVEERVLSLVLQRSGCFFSSVNGEEVLMHAMNTVSRCRGIFIGIPKELRKDIPDSSLAIFSIIMQATAQTLESFELYRFIRGVNIELQDKVRALEEEMVERWKAQQGLFQSQQMLQLILNTIPQGIFWKNNQSIYLGCNRNFARLVELDDPKDVVGKSDYNLSWRQEDAARHRNTDLLVIHNEQRQFGLIDRLVRPDAPEAWLQTDLVPLSDADGRVIGVLGCIQDITEHKRYQERLAHITLHDPLTGLPNRTLLAERLERAIERGQRRSDYNYALLMLDLDRFKQVNDTLGYNFGDEILGLMARRIGKCLRSMDTVARLGGDEFMVLLEELSLPREAIVIAKRLLCEISRPELIKNTEFMATASVGLLVNTKSYFKVNDLFRDAEIALQSAIDRGGNCFKVFSPSMLQRTMYLANLENELRRGLALNEFFVQYQPIYALENSSLVGFEALIRWRHPTRGLVSPLEFIPIAERTGIIHWLGDMVLREACGAMARWREFHPLARTLFVSVNLSGRQLSQTNLAAMVRKVLAETGLEPAALKLEITESVIMDNADLALITMRELKKQGISLAIDDFGTGHSSLSYLRRFPVDTLKIDRSFISALDNHDGRQIAQAVMALANALQLKVVAEGVENDNQLVSLRGMRCQYAQGFFFSRPLDGSAVSELLTS